MEKLAVIGLGYVGLPLALQLARSYSVVGFDVSDTRISELRSGFDRTGEAEEAALRASTLLFTERDEDIADATVFIVTVPTPVDERNEPDLAALYSACRVVGTRMQKGSLVVFESTVYPGVTEDICGAALEKASGMVCGEDFFLGYSPERINPGDKEHSVGTIAKIVSGQTAEVTDRLVSIYGTVTTGQIFQARDIRTAEAAKVIENAQRDINIAFVNELAMMFDRMGISTHDVLAAAETKWNFLPFSPGLVGGHCIGVDPYYLAHVSRELGHEPEVILAGRRINEKMPGYVADRVHGLLEGKPSRVLILGLTFKENIPDIRNSKSVNLLKELVSRGHTVKVHDPLAAPHEAKSIYGIDLMTKIDEEGPFDCVVGAVNHDAYQEMTVQALQSIITENGLIADLKGIWRQHKEAAPFRFWSL